MKILLVGPSPPPHGGISVHVEGTRRQLIRDGIHCAVLDTGKGPLGPKFACTLLWRALQGWRMEVHTNGHNRKSWLLTLVCGVAGLMRGDPVVTLHSGMVPRYLETSRSSRRLAKIACLLYSRVVCVSPAILDALAGVGVPRDKLTVSPACLSVPASAVHASGSSLDPQLKAWMDRHDPGCSTTLFFRPEYGFDLLISALKGLRRRHPAAGCVVMGSGAGRAEAERTVREAGMEDAIRMTGDVDHGICLAIMARSHVFLRPALQDGDSVSVREALALGIPVVASGVGTRPAGTILFRNGDMADLLEKIEFALSLQRVGHPGRSHAKV